MDLNYFSKTRILDGGMGQHLLAKGLKPKGSLWSATALIDKKYHQLIVDAHLDFINNFFHECINLITRNLKY